MLSLTLNPEFTFDVTEEFPAQTGELGDGVIARGEIVPRIKRAFRLVWRHMLKAEKDTLVTLFRATRGRVGSFEFTPADEVTPAVVRFFDDSLPWTKTDGRFYAVTVTVREV